MRLATRLRCLFQRFLFRLIRLFFCTGNTGIPKRISTTHLTDQRKLGLAQGALEHLMLELLGLLLCDLIVMALFLRRGQRLC